MWKVGLYKDVYIVMGKNVAATPTVTLDLVPKGKSCGDAKKIGVAFFRINEKFGCRR